MRLRAQHLVLAFLAVPAEHARAQVYIAPSNETIFVHTDRREAPPEALIYVENRSTVPIRIILVRLLDCRNLRQPCTEERANVRVRPRSRALVLRLRPQRENEAWSYRFGFRWRADTSTAQVIAGIVGGESDANRPLIVRDGVAEPRTSAGALSPAPSRRELGRDQLAEVAARVAALRTDPESLVARPGESIHVFERVSILVLDDSGQVLGSTRAVEWAPASPMLQRTGPGVVTAHRIGNSALRFRLHADALGLLPRSPSEVRVPVVVQVTPEPNAPVFAGRAVDADTRRPLACVRLALEDSAGFLVALGRSTRDGSFTLQAPTSASYRVRAEVHGWAPVHGAAQSVTAGAPPVELPVRFEQEQLNEPRLQVGDPPRLLAYRTSVAPTGQALRPVLGIVARSMAATGWIQFAVDSSSAVDTTSLLVPPHLLVARPRIVSELTRMRWAAATEEGRPACELVRTQVNITKP